MSFLSFLFIYLKPILKLNQTFLATPYHNVSDNVVGNDQRSKPQWAVLMAPTSLALTSQNATIIFTGLTVQLSHVIGDGYHLHNSLNWFLSVNWSNEGPVTTGF